MALYSYTYTGKFQNFSREFKTDMYVVVVTCKHRSFLPLILVNIPNIGGAVCIINN